MFKRSLQPDGFPQITTDSVTRAGDKIRFYLPRATMEKFKRFPMYHGSQLWDTLDRVIHYSESYLSFKARVLRTRVCEQYPV